MAGEWEYHSNPDEWTLIAGAWCAMVRRLDGPRCRWHASVTHTTDPQLHYDGPAYKRAMVARIWCLAKIVALCAKQEAT